MNRILILSVCLICSILLVGCGENKSNVPEASPKISENSDAMSNDDYKMARDLFIGQYKNSIAGLQRLVSTFDASDAWWGNFTASHQSIEDLSDSFLQNESKIPEEYKNDFDMVKQSISQYTEAFNIIAQGNGKTADEQTSIIADASKVINQANSLWDANEINPLEDQE